MARPEPAVRRYFAYLYSRRAVGSLEAVLGEAVVAGRSVELGEGEARPAAPAVELEGEAALSFGLAGLATVLSGVVFA